MDISYNWQAASLTVGLIIGTVVVGRFFAFKLPAFRSALEFNNADRKRKWRELGHKYHARVVVNQRIGLFVSLAFFALFLPFIVSFEEQAISKILLNALLVLMIYDLFCYLTHRFLFHGKGYFRRVHAVHHQARSRISAIDAQLVHPVETSIGIGLFYVVTVLLALISGETFHIATIVITFVAFTQLNQLNHVRFDASSGPLQRLVHYITTMHDAHHIDMHKGNYATITMLYDWAFGTLEQPATNSTD